MFGGIKVSTLVGSCQSSGGELTGSCSQTAGVDVGALLVPTPSLKWCHRLPFLFQVVNTRGKLIKNRNKATTSGGRLIIQEQESKREAPSDRNVSCGNYSFLSACVTEHMPHIKKWNIHFLLNTLLRPEWDFLIFHFLKAFFCGFNAFKHSAERWVINLCHISISSLEKGKEEKIEIPIYNLNIS